MPGSRCPDAQIEMPRCPDRDAQISGSRCPNRDALIPIFRPFGSIVYSWKKVGVVGYETTSDETIWFVQELDREGRVKINLKTQVKASTWPTENNQHRVNRTSLFFASENPINFAQRLKEVVDHRNEVEGLLRKSLYVDCMPTSDVPTTFDLEEIMNRTGSDNRVIQNVEKID